MATKLSLLHNFSRNYGMSINENMTKFVVINGDPAYDMPLEMWEMIQSVICVHIPACLLSMALPALPYHSQVGEIAK